MIAYSTSRRVHMEEIEKLKRDLEPEKRLLDQALADEKALTETRDSKREHCQLLKDQLTKHQNVKLVCSWKSWNAKEFATLSPIYIEYKNVTEPPGAKLQESYKLLQELAGKLLKDPGPPHTSCRK